MFVLREILYFSSLCSCGQPRGSAHSKVGGAKAEDEAVEEFGYHCNITTLSQVPSRWYEVLQVELLFNTLPISIPNIVLYVWCVPSGFPLAKDPYANAQGLQILEGEASPEDTASARYGKVTARNLLAAHLAACIVAVIG